MPASYTDWPVDAEVVDRLEAELLKHDSVGPPTRDQWLNWIRQLEDESGTLPFEDDGP